MKQKPYCKNCKFYVEYEANRKMVGYCDREQPERPACRAGRCENHEYSEYLYDTIDLPRKVGFECRTSSEAEKLDRIFDCNDLAANEWQIYESEGKTCLVFTFEPRSIFNGGGGVGYIGMAESPEVLRAKRYAIWQAEDFIRRHEEIRSRMAHGRMDGKETEICAF